MSKNISIDCNICGRRVQMRIDESKIKNGTIGILNVIFVHGNPLHGVNVHIDKNFVVRAVEYPDIFDIVDKNEDMIDDIEYKMAIDYNEAFLKEQNTFMVRTLILSIIDTNKSLNINEIYKKIIKRKNIMSNEITIEIVRKICIELEELGIIYRAET